MPLTAYGLFDGTDAVARLERKEAPAEPLLTSEIPSLSLGSARLIIGPCRIVTGGPTPHVIEDGAVRVVGAHIAYVGLIDPVVTAHPAEARWDAGGRVLVPGLVDAHTHLARHLARGLGPLARPQWDRYDHALAADDVHWASLAALVEGVRHGITTVCDVHRSGSCLDLSLSEVANAGEKVGVRVATCYVATGEDSPREQSLAIRESLALVRELRRRRSGRLRALLGVRADTLEGLESVLNRTLESAGAGLPFHLELTREAAGDQRWQGPLNTERESWLWAHAERAPLALTSALRERGDTLASAAHGLAGRDRHRELAWGSDDGIHAPPLATETDKLGSEVNGPGDFYHRRHVRGARWAARQFGDGLGVLEPGAPADLVLVDYLPATSLSSETLSAHLAHGIARAPVWGVMVAGDVVMDHGTLLTVDEAEVAARARECARRVWARLG